MSLPAELLVLTACVIDLRTGVVRRADGRDALTPRERDVLAHLAARPEIDVSLEELHREVFGFHPSVRSRAAFHTVRRLRRKIERDPERCDHVLTVPGVGYRFSPRPVILPPTGRLPAEPDGFVGRARLLDEVVAVAPGGLVTLVGVGGIGKSRLARRAAGRLGAERPVFWVDRAGVDPAGALAASLGVRVTEVEALGRWLAGTGAVVVLDDAEAATRELVGALRQHAPDVGWIATSAEPLGLRGERRVAVPPLPDDEAAALLRLRAEERGVEVDPEAAAALGRRLAGHPLAIEIGAAQLDQWTPAQLEARLPGLDWSHPAADVPERHRSVRAALDAAWSRLPDPDRRALLAAAVLGGAGAPLIERVVGGAAVRTLLDRALLVRRGERLELLDVVRAYAAERAPDELRAEVERLRAEAVGEVELGPDDGEHLVAAVRWAAAEDAERVVPLVRAARGWALSSGRARVALEVAAAASGGSAEARAEARAEVAWTEAMGGLAPLGRLAEAEASLASVDTDALPDDLARGIWLARGHVARDRGRFDEGERFLAEAERRGATAATALLAAQLAGRQGRAAEALAHATRAIAEWRPGSKAIANAYSARGAAHHLLHHVVEARADHEAALAAYRAAGDRMGEVMSLGNLAVIDEASGDPLGALERTRATAETYRRLGLARREAHWRTNLAGLLLTLGRDDLAEQELARCEATSGLDPTVQGRVWVCRGRLALRRGELAVARVVLTRALDALGPTPLDAVGAHVALAETALAEGSRDEAREHLDLVSRLLATAGVEGDGQWAHRLNDLRARLG